MNLAKPSAVPIRAALLTTVVAACFRIPQSMGVAKRRPCSFITATAMLCVLCPVTQGGERDEVLVKAGYVEADRSLAVYLEFVIERAGEEVNIKDIQQVAYAKSDTDGTIDVKRPSRCRNNEERVDKFINSPYGRGTDKRGITGEMPIAVSCSEGGGYIAIKLQNDSPLMQQCLENKEDTISIAGAPATVVIFLGHQAMCLEDLSGVADPEAAIRKILEK